MKQEIVKVYRGRPAFIKKYGQHIAVCVHDAHFLRVVQHYKAAIRKHHPDLTKIDNPIRLIKILKRYRAFLHTEKEFYRKLGLPLPPKRVVPPMEKIDIYAQKVASITHLNMPKITVEDCVNSMIISFEGNGEIVLARWCLNNENALIYNIVHEFTHLLTGHRTHTLYFKIRESEILKQFDITPIYGGNYADAVVNPKGDILWKR